MNLPTAAALDAAEKLCAEVSEGPWIAGDEDNPAVLLSTPEGWVAWSTDSEDGCSLQMRDCRFIAAARTLVPELIAALRLVAKWYDEDQTTPDPYGKRDGILRERLDAVRKMLES